MTYQIKCPAFPNPMMYHITRVFLGGGISNCPEWQEEAVTLSQDFPDSFIWTNPRRDDFDINDPSMSEWQIQWEHMALEMADGILFWFPEETLCPITLFELGVHAGHKPVFVGCHPGYKRRFDVIHQLKHIDPTIKVVDNLPELVNQVREFHVERLSNPLQTMAAQLKRKHTNDTNSR